MREIVYGGGAGGGISRCLYTLVAADMLVCDSYTEVRDSYTLWDMLVRDSCTLVRGSYTLWLVRSVAYDK